MVAFARCVNLFSKFSMKGGVILLCFVGLQCVQYGTDAQLIEVNVPKYMQNVKYVYNRLWRGANNLMNLRLMTKTSSESPIHNAVKQNAQSSEFHPSSIHLPKWNNQPPQIIPWDGYQLAGVSPLQPQLYGPPKGYSYSTNLPFSNDLTKGDKYVHSKQHGYYRLNKSAPSQSHPYGPYKEHYDQSKRYYDPPKGHYDPPKGHYGPLKGHYGPPKGHYDQPKGHYDPPKGNYDPPKGHYGPLKGHYGPSKEHYEQPKGHYDPPKGNYDPPKEHYDQPKGHAYDPPKGQSYGPLKGQFDPPKGHSYGPTQTKGHNDQPKDEINKNRGWGWRSCDDLPRQRLSLRRLLDLIQENGRLPDGWQVESPRGTVVNFDNINFETVPPAPSVIKLGIRERVPPGYSRTYFKRTEITPSRSLFDIKEKTYYKEDEKSTSTHNFELLINEQPKPNTFVIFSEVLQSPNISGRAPIDNTIGNRIDDFNLGLMARDNAFRNSRQVDNLLESQIKALGDVFDQIQSIEEEEPLPPFQEQHEGHYGGGKKVEAPFIVYQVLRSTIPDVDTSESHILDSVYNFGLPASQMEFGDLSLIPETWETIRNTAEDIDPNELGSSRSEVIDSFKGWITNYVKNVRKIFLASYTQAERKASQGFNQYQYYLVRPGECPADLDPPGYMGTASLGCVGGGGRPPRRSRNNG